MRRTVWTWLRLLGGSAILGVLLWRVGTGPFLDGLRTIDVRSLAVAAGIAVLGTMCCAWRWSLVARGLGIGIPFRAAVTYYYRSQFLNTTLPGGVLGDVHRGLRHGRDVNDSSRALRAVAWERFAGQIVQAVITLAVLMLLPSPVRPLMPFVAVVVLVTLPLAAFLARVLPRNGSSLLSRTVRTATLDIRDGLLPRRSWPGIALASALAVTCHVATFLVAARTAGVSASPLQMLPLALLVLLAMGIPLNVAGWGPREGVAAWAFAAAGLGASQGVTTAVVYGVMIFVASLPGAVVLVLAWLRRDGHTAGVMGKSRARSSRARPSLARPSLPPPGPTAALEGGPRG